MWAFALWDGARSGCSARATASASSPSTTGATGGGSSFASELKAFRCGIRRRLEPNLSVVRDYHRAGLRRPHRRHVLRRHRAGCRRHTRSSSTRRPAPSTRYWSARAARRARRPGRSGSRALPGCRSGCACEATSRSAPASRAASTRRRSPVRSTTSSAREAATSAPVGARSNDVHRLLRAITASTSARTPRPSSRGPAPSRTGSRSRTPTSSSACPPIVEAQDEPFGSTSIVAQWFVMREAPTRGRQGDARRPGRRRVAARLSDHLRVSVRRSARGRRSAPARIGARGVPPVARRERGRDGRRTRDAVPAGQRPLGAPVAPWWSPRARPSLAARRRRNPRANALTVQGTVATPVPRSSSPERGLPELLRYEDRNSMTHSVEARVPFLDYRLVELLYSLPADELISNGVHEGRAPTRSRRPVAAGGSRSRRQARLCHSRSALLSGSAGSSRG